MPDIAVQLPLGALTPGVVRGGMTLMGGAMATGGVVAGALVRRMVVVGTLAASHPSPRHVRMPRSTYWQCAAATLPVSSCGRYRGSRKSAKPCTAVRWTGQR